MFNYIDKNNITIKANLEKGIFYGLQSLFQLVLSNNDTLSGVEIPTLEISDYPNYNYRGMHLDVSRHMFPVEFIKKYIDLLAFYKFNTFHWHLTDDQGWRIEIKKYPKLTSKGAWRNGSMIGDYNEQKFDTIKYGGFYTQEQIKEIVDTETDPWGIKVEKIEIKDIRIPENMERIIAKEAEAELSVI